MKAMNDFVYFIATQPGMTSDNFIHIVNSMNFAYGAHTGAGQVRKYSDENYMIHPLEVATILIKNAKNVTTDMICAALLHDVVEDTSVSLNVIETFAGKPVRDLVDWLTDVSKPEDGNRAMRKAIDRKHTHEAPYEAQTIKVCDLIANTLDITRADPDFAKVYIKEKKLLLEGMSADPILMDMAWKIIQEYEQSEYEAYLLKYGTPQTDAI